MDSKNFTIGVLSTTAVILLVGLLIINTRPQLARGSGMAATAGEYVLTVGGLSIDDEELLFVMNAPKEAMIIYSFDVGSHKIKLVDRIDLGQMRTVAGNAPKSTGRKRAPRRRGP